MVIEQERWIFVRHLLSSPRCGEAAQRLGAAGAFINRVIIDDAVNDSDCGKGRGEDIYILPALSVWRKIFPGDTAETGRPAERVIFFEDC